MSDGHEPRRADGARGDGAHDHVVGNGGAAETHHADAGGLSGLAIRRPVFTTMVMLGLVVLAVVTFLLCVAVGKGTGRRTSRSSTRGTGYS